MSDNGWFAEKELGAQVPWQPTIQLDGICLSLSIWFNTEIECLEWIHTKIIGSKFLVIRHDPN